MKTLAHSACQQEIAARIAALTPSDSARWGQMNVHQMIRHTADAYYVAAGEIPIAPRKLPMLPRVIKFVALRLPCHWPHGVPSPPEIDQQGRGSPPGEFEHDRAALLSALRFFCNRIAEPCVPHPLFGRMSVRDWQRWGYLHGDHHLRQFGR
jgi:hypothetical protein